MAWAKLTADRVTYYSNSVADGRESYYSDAGEAPGVWLGEAARMLDLSGELQPGELARMAAWTHYRRVGRKVGQIGEELCAALQTGDDPRQGVRSSRVIAVARLLSGVWLPEWSADVRRA